MKILEEFEEWLFWKLCRRWRDRATLAQIKGFRSWLSLDVSLKSGGKEH